MVDLGHDTDLSGLEAGAALANSARTSIASNRAKRTLDLLIALVVLVFVLPLLAIVSICILLDSPGPVLFRQRRTGLAGETIRIYKFRTMTVMEDGEDVRHAARHDDCITRIGRFLRRSSIDELPQLINIIKGEMSLVGPRPHALAHDQYYGALVPQYSRRFRVKPGITGLAQVHGLRGEIMALEDMVDRVALDNDYIERWSLGLDLQILAKTAVVTAFQSSAY